MSERRKGSGCLVAVVVLIALLSGAVVIGDNLTRDYVEEEFATGVQSELGMDVPPEVDIQGWPFLWQLWQRKFDHVQMNAAQATLSDQERSIRVDDLHVDLHGVNASQDYTELVAERLNATGRLSWDELSRLVDGGQVSAAGSDRIKIRYTLEVFGQTIDVEASGKPVLDAEAQKLKIEDVDLRVVGMDVPRAITEELMRLRLGEIDLALPMGLRVDALGVAERGIEVQVSGTEVPLRR
ncbi:LmeA family phospholipid-binding protein [Enemella sp. A6]|uniref:LmeA family phospholipid-binding protein n=1 Tax=Enemella sp. A6 TaxID=3440152 RepID=UPI003EB73457